MAFTATDKLALISIRNAFYDLCEQNISAYIGAKERHTPTIANSVTATYEVVKMGSVWLATDATCIGTNYYADSKAVNFVDKVITLDSNVPSTLVDGSPVYSAIDICYYQACPLCGWDSDQQAGRDSACPTCEGLGKVLSLGSAVSVPILKRKTGGWKEPTGTTGLEINGKIVFQTKYEYENLLRAAIKLELDGLDIRIARHTSGSMLIQRIPDISGQDSIIQVVAEYEKFPD